MKKRSLKALICFALGVMMFTSLTACGGNEISVDDYGDATDMAKASEKDSDSDEVETVKTTGDMGKSFRDIYGDKVGIDEAFTVGNTEINTMSHANIPIDVYPTVYKSKLVDDGKADEDKLVKSILGDDAKKLEEISYDGGADYVTMLQKYHEILVSHEYAMLDPSTQLTEPLEEEQKDPKDCVYKWKDDSDIYIHMYEGKYNNTRFGLILAYDYQRHQKTIFLDPISINEYLPGADYKALIVEETVDDAGNEKELNNACSYTNAEALDMAKEFLESKLGLGNGIVNLSSNDSLLYQSLGHGEGGLLTVDSFMASSIHDGADSVLTFVDSALSGTEFHSRSVIKDYRDLQYTTDKSENPNYYVDGYAFFLSPLYPSDMDGAVNNNLINGNYGLVKVTGNGIYGVDLTLVSEVTEIVNDVKLLDYDTLIESFQNKLKDELDTTKINVPINANHLEIHRFMLLYYPYFEKEDVKEFSYIPVWYFNMSCLNGHGAYAVVNAMDGSISEISYY